MPTFRDVDHDPFAEAKAGGPTFRDVEHDPFADAAPASTGWDMAKGAGVGLAKGAINIAGLPGDINSALKRGKCCDEQVGVNAPGKANNTTVLPANKSSVLTSFQSLPLLV